MSVPSIYMVGGRLLGSSGSIFSTGFGSGFYPSGHWVQSNLALTILAPNASATSTNRYQKHYPGIALTMPAIVYGGAWPYVYSLSGQPSGMTIGTVYGSTNYGNITWNNPTAGSYTITMTVTDQTFATTSVTWTLVVSTSNWIFVDAVNGNASANNGGTGTGTQGNPFKTMNDWYAGTSGSGSGTRFDTTYINYGVIYQSGSYLMDACFVDSNGAVEMGDKPKVHLAAPGASVNFDPHNSGSKATLFFGAVANVYFGNINFTDVANMGLSGLNNSVRIASGSTDCGMFQCTWATPSTPAVTSSNPAFFMCEDNHPSIGQRIFMSQCTTQGTNGYDIFLSYYTQYTCLLDNQIQGVNTDIAFYMKLGTNDTCTIRGNTGLAANSGVLTRLDNYNGVTNFDVSWNNYASSGSGIYYGPNGGGTGISGGASYRNTWQVFGQTIDGGAATIPVSNLAVANDVVVYSDSSANAHGYILIPSGASLTSATFIGEECVGLNLACVAAATGNLTGTYRTNYLGLRGHEVA